MFTHSERHICRSIYASTYAYIDYIIDACVYPVYLYVCVCACVYVCPRVSAVPPDNSPTCESC